MAERSKGTPAGERLRRLLLVVPYAITHPGSRIEDLAAMFGTAPEELEEDIAVLGFTGLPPYGGGQIVDAWVEDGVVSIAMTPELQRPLRLTRPEGLALYLRATEAIASLPEVAADALGSAREKLAGALGRSAADDLRRSVEVAPAAEPPFLAAIRGAVARCESLGIRYYAASRGETTDRRIDAEAVFRSGGAWYVVAWDHLRNAERVFRADRILEVTPTGETFTRRGLEGEGRAIFDPAAADIEVRLLLRPGARWVADYYVTTEQLERDGDLEVAIPAARLEWVERLLLRLGGDARVLAPADLADRAAALAEAALARYR